MPMQPSAALRLISPLHLSSGNPQILYVIKTETCSETRKIIFKKILVHYFIKSTFTTCAIVEYFLKL